MWRAHYQVLVGHLYNLFEISILSSFEIGHFIIDFPGVVILLYRDLSLDVFLWNFHASGGFLKHTKVENSAKYISTH